MFWPPFCLYRRYCRSRQWQFHVLELDFAMMKNSARAVALFEGCHLVLGQSKGIKGVTLLLTSKQLLKFVGHSPKNLKSSFTLFLRKSYLVQNAKITG
jgi:hypothetical protein